MTLDEARAQAARVTVLFRSAEAEFGFPRPKANRVRPKYMEAFRLRAEIEAAGYHVITDRSGLVSVSP